MRHHFETSQWVPFPMERVFAFFADPANLPPLMPTWQKARIDESRLVAPQPLSAQSGTGQVFAGAGSRMTISFQALPILPLRMKWDAEIVEFVWHDHFCDLQRSGPFAYWRHCHRVAAEVVDGVEGTRVMDSLIYELPFGPLSEPVHALFLRRQVRAIFAYRQQRLLQLLSG